MTPTKFSAQLRPPENLSGSRYALELTVGAVGDHFAGHYRDTLILSIEPR